MTDPDERLGRGPLSVPGRSQSGPTRVDDVPKGVNSLGASAVPNHRDLPRKRTPHLSEYSQSGILIFAKIGALAAAAVVFFALGFRSAPTAGGPPEIPGAPALNLAFTSLPRTLVPGSLSVYAYLRQLSSDRTRLTLEVYGDFRARQWPIKWSLDVTGFNGYNCQLRPAPAPSERISGPDSAKAAGYVITGSSSGVPPSQAADQPFIFVRFCWQRSSPITSSGSYLAAELPRVSLTEGTGTVARILQLPGQTLSQYASQGGISPTAMTDTKWVWTSALSNNLSSQASAPIPVIAASIAGLQQDNHRAFLSGIFFGIAGGALVTLIPESFGAAGRRKETGEKRKQLPSAGS
jgi:hypothetical protein